MEDVTLLVEAGGEWLEPEAVGYVAERELQELLAANPRLIPGLTGRAVAVREFQTAVGPIDLVVVDESGQITVVEVKQSSNDQSRREIVGQALDYAGRLWEMTLSQFEAEWARRHPDKRGATELLGLDGPSQEVLEQSLATGRFRLVLALDKLNPRLCRLVDYLNQHTADSLTVVAMEFRHWRHAGARMLIPRTHGVEAAVLKERKASPAKESWTDPTATAWLKQHHPEAVNFSLELVSELRSRPLLRFAWTAANTPSFVVAVTDPTGKDSFPYWAVFGQRELGQLRVPFKWLMRYDKNRLGNFVDLLGAEPRLGVVAEAIREEDFKGMPSVPLSSLHDPSLRNALLAAAESLATRTPAPIPAR